MANNPHRQNSQIVLAAPAEDLCLAFANSRYWRGRVEPTETLHDFGDLLAWLERNSGSASVLLSDARAWASDHPADAMRAAAEGIGLRETIYRLFTAIATGATVTPHDIDHLNKALAAAPPRLRLVSGSTGIGWATDAVPTLPALLAPVLWSAADLLTNAGNRRLRRCANDECLWLFMDHSKGGTRRWCDMNSCGNRAKARRHYLRSRHGKEARGQA